MEKIKNSLTNKFSKYRIKTKVGIKIQKKREKKTMENKSFNINDEGSRNGSKLTLHKVVKSMQGITLIALVVTIIVLLILAGIALNLTIGQNGIFSRAQTAANTWRNAETNEQLALGELGNWIGNYLGENENGGSSGNEDGELTFADVYTDDMIGQKITYSSNGQKDWIVFGKDSSENILITTEFPIDNQFDLYGSVEKWLTYEDDLNDVCDDYGGSVQGRTVNSRSITMDDINYVAGFTEPEWDSYTFCGTQNYNEKQVDYWYPSESAADTDYWEKDPNSNPQSFDNDWYYYYCDWYDGTYYYGGADTGGDDVPIETRNINTENLHYIWGGNTEDTYYSEYLVASRSVDVNSDGVYFNVASAGAGGAHTDDNNLCYSTSTSVSWFRRAWLVQRPSRSDATI